MSYLVLARKYRPETFGDVVGQEFVAKTLCNSIEQRRIAHAFLFSGPRGVGKTSMARILSKAFNCAGGPTSTPCLECEQCRAITAGSAIDVIEIDAASNRGIDNIRSLRENVRYTPAGSRFKIYIVDEVHMLTTESFNALLKTLEEPPDHVKFIFATTEPQKLPETVRSRCQCFEFKRISADEIAARLEFILQNEGISFEPGLLRRIGSYSRGGMRDAQSLLDQLIAFGGDCVTFEGLSELTGSLSPEAVAELVDSILDQNVTNVIQLVDRFFAAGTRAEDLFRELMEYYRHLMLLLAGAGSIDYDAVGIARQRLEEQSKRIDLDKVLILLQATLQAMKQSRLLDDERLLTEMTLIKMTRVSSSMAISEALNLLKSSGGVPRPLSPAKSPAPERGATRGSAARANGARSSSAPQRADARSLTSSSPKRPPHLAGSGGGRQPPSSEAPRSIPPDRKEDLQNLFDAVLQEVEKSSKSTAVSLKRLQPVRLDGNDFLLVDPGGAGKMLLDPNDPTVARKLQEASQQVAGRALRFTLQQTRAVEEQNEIPPIVEKARDLFDGNLL